MPLYSNHPENSPIYYEHHEDGFWCSVDGLPEYFKSHFELQLFASDTGRELIEVTQENESELRASGAFNRVFDDE